MNITLHIKSLQLAFHEGDYKVIWIRGKQRVESKTKSTNIVNEKFQITTSIEVDSTTGRPVSQKMVRTFAAYAFVV